MMIDKESCLQVALCTKPHGINGAVVLRVGKGFNIESVSFEFLFLELDGGLVPFGVDEIREKNQDEAIVSFIDVDTQEKARRLADIPVYVQRHWLSGDESDDFTTGSLIGYEAYDTEQGLIGTIVRIEEIVNNPLFVVSRQDEEILIPIVDDFISQIDEENQKIIFSLPEGLLDLQS